VDDNTTSRIIKVVPSSDEDCEDLRFDEVALLLVVEATPPCLMTKLLLGLNCCWVVVVAEKMEQKQETVPTTCETNLLLREVGICEEI